MITPDAHGIAIQTVDGFKASQVRDRIHQETGSQYRMLTWVLIIPTGLGVLELAGGTHLVLVPRGEDGGLGLAPGVDLMVDDVDAAHEAWAEYGPSEIKAGGVHRTFRFHDPAGNEIAVHDSHVTGVV